MSVPTPPVLGGPRVAHTLVALLRQLLRERQGTARLRAVREEPGAVLLGRARCADRLARIRDRRHAEVPVEREPAAVQDFVLMQGLGLAGDAARIERRPVVPERAVGREQHPHAIGVQGEQRGHDAAAVNELLRVRVAPELDEGLHRRAEVDGGLPRVRLVVEESRHRMGGQQILAAVRAPLIHVERQGRHRVGDELHRGEDGGHGHRAVGRHPLPARALPAAEEIHQPARRVGGRAGGMRAALHKLPNESHDDLRASTRG
jgi:hypothetical protein